jgi:ribose transport system substrate-binding protein
MAVLNGLRAKYARVSVGLAILAAAATLVACGSDDEDTPAATSSDSGGSANACMTKVRDLVEQEKAPMQMVIPSAGFDMSKNKGKELWFISPSQATGYALALSKVMTEGAKTAGMSMQIFDGKGQPDRFTEGLTQAVGQGAKGIVLYGIDPALVPEGLKRAKEAKIPVITIASGKPAPADGTVAEAINHDVDAQGTAMAHYGIMAANCEVNAATSFDSTYPALVSERDAIEKVFQDICPDTCKVQNHEFKLGEMATDLGPSTQSLIQRNPDLTTLFATFDQAATYEIPAVEQSNSDVKIVGTNGLVENLKQVQSGSPQVADVAYVPPQFLGWLGIDQIGRAMLGEELGDDSGEDFVMPVQTFDKDNLPSDVEDFGALFPELADYQNAFREKWQM